MPFLNGNLSVGGIEWSMRNEGKAPIKDFMHANFQGDVKSMRTNNFEEWIVVGGGDALRPGEKASERYLQYRQLEDPDGEHDKIAVPRQPYVINNTAGTAGDMSTVITMAGVDILPIAMIDMDQLEDRMNAEFMRGNPNNPLSAQYAMEVALEQDTFNPNRIRRNTQMNHEMLNDFMNEQETKRQVKEGNTDPLWSQQVEEEQWEDVPTKKGKKKKNKRKSSV